ncbi:MAG: cohesin domain-containing protein [bacterium]
MKKFVFWLRRARYIAFAWKALLFAAIPTASFSYVIHVPQDYLTIEGAVAHAVDWDTILVAEGTYDGLHYVGSEQSPRNITLLGSGWPNGTVIISPPDSLGPFALKNVHGWRITNFEMTQGGLLMWCDSLFKCEIDHNYIHGARAGIQGIPYWAVAITTESLYGVRIHHNLVLDCDHSGFSFQIFFAPDVIIRNVRVYNNTFSDMIHEGIIFKGPGHDPESCIITNNIIVECGGQGLEFAFCDQQDTEVSYNCVYHTAGPWQNVDPGPGNIYVNPEFLQASTIPEYYYLSSESPCVNTGNPDPFYNDPDGTRSDMGAFPYGGLLNIVRLRIEWVSAYPGDTVYVPLTISEVTGLGVASAELTIHYPTDDLEFLEITLPDGSLPHQAGWALQYEDLNGTFHSTLSGGTPLAGAGLLAMMAFVLDEDASPGTWNVGFIEALLNDGAIEVTTTDGGITFSAEDLLYGDVNLSGNVTLSDVSLLFNYLAGGAELNQLQRLLAEVSGLADITSYDGSLITRYCFGEFELFPVEGGSIEMDAEGELRIEGGTAEPGEEFEVTVEIENGINVSATQFEMILGGAPVELADLTVPGGRVWFSRCRGVYPNYEIYLGGNEILNGHQEVVTMAFQIPDTASGLFSVRLTNILLNETEVAEDVYQDFRILDAASPVVSLPEEFAFRPAYPNPFNVMTHLSFALPKSSEVTLRVYNSLGQTVDVLSLGTLPAGWHQRQWDASHFPSGLYIAELIANGNRATQKLLLIK